MSIELGFDEPGYSFFIDGLLKAYDVGNSLYVDYWGEPVADAYREEALKPLLAQMRDKASEAMPEFWEQLDTDEQDELAEMYAYFDFKLALFLMGAGEYSYLKFIDTPLANSAGTDFFKNITPFPEWDMPLGEPLEDAQQDGNVWTRRFEYVEIILDLDNGTATYLDPGSLDAMESADTAE
jgi:hypothetical protein